MIPLRIEEIGGAIVRRPFNSPGIAEALGQASSYIKNGTRLTPELLATMVSSTRNTLIERGALYCWPKDVSAAPAERFVVDRRFGRFDVIEGRKVNADYLSKEEAKALAAEG